MAGKKTGLQRTYQIGDADGVAMYTGVTYGAIEGQVIKPVADNAVPVGIVDNDERINDPLRAGGDQTGRDVAVQVDGYGAIKISGNVSYGDRLILGIGGVAKKMPDGTGAKEKTTITVTTAPTQSGNVTVTLNGDDNVIALDPTEQSTEALTATALAASINSLEGYSATASGAIVTIEAVAKGVEVDATFDGGETGAKATVKVETQGSADNTGNYNVLGFAEKSGVDGDIIPVKMNFHTYRVE